MTNPTPGPASDPPRAARRREPAFNLPGVILVVCGVLVAIQAMRAFISVETDNWIMATFAFMPARVTIALHLMPGPIVAAYHALVDHNQLVAAQIDFLIGDGRARWWTFITYAFLHGGWAHVGFNCVWLIAFGSPVARRFTASRFLLLLFVAALAGSVAEYLCDMTGFQLVLGASAAVSGAMGAATRFVFRPNDEPVRLFDRARLEEAFRQPALTLRRTLTTKAALVFIVFWFATNLLLGYLPAIGGIGDGPIAWQAHIGGFLAGLLLFPLFDTRRAMPGPDESEDVAIVPDEHDGRPSKA